MAGGCAYQDFRRPLLRNYASDLLGKPTRPPETVEARVRPHQELAAAWAEWRRTVGRGETAYSVGAGDQLSLSVGPSSQTEAEISTKVYVTGDGYVACPFLGDVGVGGLSTSGIEEKLTALYQDGLYQHPLVSVVVSEHQSKHVVVSGAVQEPGAITLSSDSITILEALLRAGGLAEDAGKWAVVTRVFAGQSEPGNDELAPKETVNLDILIRQCDLRENIVLRSGDIVHVYAAEPEHFYVLGYVRAPGVYKLPKRGSIGLMDAIAHARGLAGAARSENTHILRMTDKGVQRYRVSLPLIAQGKEPDVTVRPGDRIVVGTSWTRRSIDGLLHAMGLRSLVVPVVQ